MSLELRDYQHGTIAGCRRELATHRSTLAALATGLGKTVIAAATASSAQAKGNRTLFLAHRDELLEQATKKLRDAGCVATLEKGAARADDSPVVVASVQSLRGKRLRRFARDYFKLLIVDEAHRSAAAGYRAIFDHFDAAKIIGITATPIRGDGQALGEIYESVAYRYELRQAIRDGWLAPLVAKRVQVEGLDLSKIRTRAGDLAQDELAAEMARAVQATAVPLVELAGDRKTIAFCVDVAHAQALADELNRLRPDSARAVSGDTHATIRKQTLVDFAAGAFQFLINCALYTEGFDEPSISCVAMCRPTKSLGLYIQCIGRGTRLFEGKADCLLLDFCGNAGRHRLITPADCLAGELLGDSLLAQVNALLGASDLSLDDAIEAGVAQAAANEAAARVEAQVRYFVDEIDPFVGADDSPLEMDPAWSREPLPRQLVAQLAKQGVKNPPETLSRADGERLLSRLIARRRNNLCTLGQARQLAKAGIDTRTLSRERADQLILVLKSHAWHPRALAAEPEAVLGRALKRAA